MLAYMCIKTAIMVLKDKTADYDVTIASSFAMIVGFPIALCVDVLFSPFEILGFVAYFLRRGENNVKD